MKAYQHIDVKRASGPVGAEVSGVDLAEPLPPAVFKEVHQAWLDHAVLFFRGQHLTPAQQATFSRQFGELDVYPFMRAVDSHPNVIPIIKEKDAKINFGGGWHTDTSYLPIPPKATVLYAVEVPEHGGDTLFADTAAAYDKLSDGMKKLLEGLIGVFSAQMVHGGAGAYQNSSVLVDLGNDYGGSKEDAQREVEHPIIRTHPETGRKSIYCSTAHTHRIKGMSREESLPIFEYLMRQATRLENTTRFQWSSGTLAIWDNRRLFHYALNDYHGHRRHMHRVIVQGEKPV